MGSKLYVGNLNYEVTGSDLQALFQSHGTVESAEVIADRDTGRSKGFGFVQMASDAEAQAAIAALNGQDHQGRALTVNVAKPREDRPRTSGGIAFLSSGVFTAPANSCSPFEFFATSVLTGKKDYSFSKTARFSISQRWRSIAASIIIPRQKLLS